MATTAASKFIRSSTTPIRNLIHRHLQPTVAATASATTQHGTAAVYDWNYLFPHTFGHPWELKSNNQAVSKLPSGNQFGLCGFSVLDDQSRVQALARGKKVDITSDTDDEDKVSDDDSDIDIDRLPSDDDDDFDFEGDEDFDAGDISD